MTREEALARFDRVIHNLDSVVNTAQSMGPLVKRFGYFLKALNINLKEIRAAL